MKKYIAVLLAFVMILGLIPMTASAEDVAAVTVEQSVPDATMMLKDHWYFVVDKADSGEKEQWYQGFPGKGKEVSLPYNPGLNNVAPLWFYNKFTPDLNATEDQRIIAQFQGLCYYAKIWINGNFVGENEGTSARFSFDVTDYIREDEENMIAIRLYTPNKNSTMRDVDYDAYPVPHPRAYIQQPVYLSVAPKIAMDHVYVDTKYETGNVEVNVVLNNPTNETVAVDLAAQITPSGQNVAVANGKTTVEALPGSSSHTLTVQVKDFHAWSPDDPYLYDAKVSAKADTIAYSDSTVIQVGFKDLRIDDDGYFMLNGERFYVKSIHVTNTQNFPVFSSQVGTNMEPFIAMLDFIKASGFNMVRFLANPGMTEMVEYCDKIGLLVYHEIPMAWQEDSQYGEEFIRRDLAQILARDRNHASFAIIGVLNETYDNKTDYVNNFRAAVGAIDVIRAYDNDILALLSSGRWDNDGTVASASNPGSSTWDAYLGDEGEERTNTEDVGILPIGDIHNYPRLPLNKSVREEFMGYSTLKRAVFISEGGIGSQANIVAALRTWQQETEGDVSASTVGLSMGQITKLYSIYTQYNMASAYASPELLLRDTQKISADSRGQYFDFVRSNYKINGYSLTMGIDANTTGEGVLEETVDLKDGHYEMLRDGWADTRWCLNIDQYSVYNKDGLGVEIYLSDLGKLEAKEYTARMTVTGINGQVWEKEISVTPARDDKGNFLPSVLAYKDTIPLTDLPAGEYRINIDLVGTGVSRTRTFWVFEESNLPKLSGTVYTMGFKGESLEFLKKSGLNCIELDYTNIPAGCTVLLGGKNMKNRELKALYESVETTGTTLVGVNPAAFGDWSMANMPWGNKIYQVKFDNWLYHNDSLMLDTTLTDGLQDNRIASPMYYQEVYPNTYFNIPVAEEDALALSMFVGNGAHETNTALELGVLAGTYAHGQGKCVIHTFKLLDNLGTPVADRMLINLLSYALNEC